MFCASCGQQLTAEVSACPACGTGFAASASPVLQRVLLAGEDLLATLVAVFREPMDGVHSAFLRLGDRRALFVGIGAASGFALLVAVGALVVTSKLGVALSLSSLLKTLISGFVPPAALSLALLGVQRIATSKISWPAAAFTGGIVTLPLGLFAVLAAVLGFGNAEVVSLLGVLLVTYLVAILLGATTQLLEVPGRLAPLAVGVAFLAALWLSKIIGVSMLGSSNPLALFH